MEIEVMAEQIATQYGLDTEEVKKRLNILINTFKISPNEARRATINYFLKEKTVEVKSKDVQIEEIENLQPGEYVNLKVKVIKTYEGTKNKPSAAIVGDSSGVTRVIWWRKDVKLEKGKCYAIEKALVNQYRDSKQVQLERTSEIREVDEDIQLPSRKVEVAGVVVSTLKSSGLIPRCPECGKITNKKVCPDHGKVTPKFEYRAKLVVDDGEKCHEVIVKGEILEKVSGISEDEARKIARETMSLDTVREELDNRLFGKYIRVEGAKYRDWVIAESVEFLKPAMYDFVEEEIDFTTLLEDDELEGEA